MSDRSIPNARLWPLLLSLAVVGCVVAGCQSETARAEKPAESAGGASVPASGDVDDVLAVVGGEPVTRAEIEKTIGAQLTELERRRFELVQQALNQAINERLVSLEAAAQGVTAEEYLAANVAEPSDVDVDAFYQANQARIRRPKEQVANDIRNYLRQERMTAHGKELLAKHEVVVYLDPPRVEIDVAGHPSKGPESAPLTLVEFSDFECPFCSRVNPSIAAVRKTYGDQLRVVFRQFPLPIHPRAPKAAEASLCAHDQGKFWEMHDLLFEEQRKLAVDDLKEKAVRLGLDAESFSSCLDGGKYAAQVAADLEEGRRLGVSGTPALFLNGRFLPGGALPEEQLAEFIDQELARSK